VSGYNNQSGSYGDDFEHQDGTTGGGLRKQLEDALAEIKKLRQDLGKDERDKTAETALKDKGLDPALKALIPDDAEPAAWVDQYATLLGAKPGAQAAEVKDEAKEEPEPEAPQVDDPALVAEREALAEIQGAADAGSPAHLTGDVLERMEKIQSEEELIKFFQSNGALTDG
jgi:hypothetical protein